VLPERNLRTIARGGRAIGHDPVNILLVDDRPENLLALEAILAELGEALVRAHSGAEALRRVLEADFAAVLLDVRMPGLSGFEVAKLIRARERSRHTPILFLTAADGDDFPVEEAYALGAVDYLVKPFVPVILRAKVGVFVELFRRTREAQAAERRLAEAAHARLAAIVESSDDAILSHDPGGAIQSWNAGAERLFGYAAAEAVGRPVTLIAPPERLGEQRDILDRVRRGERVDPIETVRVAKDGRRIDVSLAVSPIRDPDGRVVGASKVARDVTARKRAERAVRFLSDASASLAELVDYESTLQRIANLAVGEFADWCVVDILDDDGRRRRLGVTKTPAGAAGGRPADFGPAEGAAGVVPHVLRTGEPEVVPDLAALDPGSAPLGPERVAGLRGLGVRSYLCVPLLSRGRVIGGMTFLSSCPWRRYGPEELRAAENLAERVATAIENARLYRALQEQDRRKDEFLATLAHELRNPLAPVRTGVQILRAAAPPDPRVGATLGMMERQLAHLVHLVDDLMDASRVSSGKVALRKERVELKVVVDAAVETTRSAVEAAGHELTVALPDGPLALDADPTRLVQVLTNLLNNAAKYTPPGGRIVVSVGRDAESAVVRVADTGVGIPADMLPKVFEMFTQVGASIDRSQGGLGIGLTLVKRLVEMHGGTVRADSPGPGRGTTFTVRLPLAAGPAAGEPRTAGVAGDGPAGPSPILVVDDNRDAAETLGMLLEMRGHEVRTAQDGPEALAVLGGFRPQLILLDLGLPGMSGYEVARRVRESAALRGVTLAALTGWGQEEDRRRTREAGFDHHLVKPVDPAALERILAQLRGAG
jgi:PAS domain S-box-containing protein